MDRDAVDLARLGKRPVLKRRFGLMSLLGFSCTILITWEGVLIVLEIGFTNGGPAGLVYGFLLVWIGTATVFACLSELVSMMPTAGGQYHWVSVLAPRSSRRFLSYATGWLTVWGWQATLASVYYLAGTQIQGLIKLNSPTYDSKPWHTMLLFWASMIFTICVNTVGCLLPKFERFVLILHVVGFLAILLPLAILGSHQSASEVFSNLLNSGNWPTRGLSFVVGIIGSVYVFTGADGAIHMSEEIEHASMMVPRAIMLSILINGSLGFGMLIVTLFSLDDIKAALETTTGLPFIEIFLQSTGSIVAVTCMVSLLVVMQYAANVGLLASASRMCWSFSRDRGLPGWRLLQHVDPRTTLPIRSILVTTTVSLLLSFIILGSATAFNDMVSLSVSSLQSSYLVAISLLLHRRSTGAIRPRKLTGEREMVAERGISWGPWHMPGRWGIAVNVLACGYLTVIVFFSFWPTGQPVRAGNMNYAVVVTGAVVMVSVIYYQVWARKVYAGPVIEIA